MVIPVALHQHGGVDLQAVDAVVAVAFADEVELVALQLAGPVVALPEPAGVALAGEGDFVDVGQDVGAVIEELSEVVRLVHAVTGGLVLREAVVPVVPPGQYVRCLDGRVIRIIFRPRRVTQNFFHWTVSPADVN